MPRATTTRPPTCAAPGWRRESRQSAVHDVKWASEPQVGEKLKTEWHPPFSLVPRARSRSTQKRSTQASEGKFETTTTMMMQQQHRRTAMQPRRAFALCRAGKTYFIAFHFRFIFCASQRRTATRGGTVPRRYGNVFGQRPQTLPSVRRGRKSNEIRLFALAQLVRAAIE